MGLGQKPGRELCCPDVWDPRWVISLSGPSLSPPGMGHLLSTASCRHERGSAGTARPGLRGQAEEMCSQPLSNSVQSSSQKEGTETARELTWREEALPGCTFHRPAGIRRKEGGVLSSLCLAPSARTAPSSRCPLSCAPQSTQGQNTSFWGFLHWWAGEDSGVRDLDKWLSLSEPGVSSYTQDEGDLLLCEG